MAKKTKVRTASKRSGSKRRGPRSSQFVLNCFESKGRDTDWGFEDAVSAGVVATARVPRYKDLRASWWRIADQGRTGACVGFATADGVLRYQFVKARKLATNQKLSVRFVWMANKETDNITAYPTTFIESAGTQTKLALGVARKYGCVLEQDLPISGQLSTLSTAAFYARAAQFRISSYINLGHDLDHWRSWIANTGPILTRLNVDRTWDQATQNRGKLERYLRNTRRGGHAVSLVGYTRDYFIVRNSWGTGWGHRGFAYASNDYAAAAFTEAYGAVL